MTNRNKTKAAVLLAGGLLLTTGAGSAQSPRTFTGEVMDSSCARKGSHAAMEKEQGTGDAKDCTMGCVKAGAKFVLHSGPKIYALDDQAKPEPFAGRKVIVTGTFDPVTNTIHVLDIHR